MRVAASSGLGLIVPTEGWQERRYLSILHRPVLSSGVLCGRVLRPGILLRPDLSSGNLNRPYLCPRTMDGKDVPVLLHGPERYSGIFCNLRWGILNRLDRPDLCLRIFLGRPSLILPEQDFRRRVTIFHPTLTDGFGGGDNFVPGRRVLRGQR
jgi:hypothetical protein